MGVAERAFPIEVPRSCLREMKPGGQVLHQPEVVDVRVTRGGGDAGRDVGGALVGLTGRV